jgi:hypothetical protein
VVAARRRFKGAAEDSSFLLFQIGVVRRLVAAFAGDELEVIADDDKQWYSLTTRSRSTSTSGVVRPTTGSMVAA